MDLSDSDMSISDSEMFDDNKIIKEKINNLIDEKIYSLVKEIEEIDSSYYNNEEITKDFKKSLRKNWQGMMNRCLECGSDMGIMNPRQLCGKTYCYGK